jgi:peroxiredoxin
MASSPRQAERARKSNLLPLFLIGGGLLALGVASFLFLLGLGKESADAGSYEYPSVTPIEVDFPAPELSMIDIQGAPVSLEDYAGKVTLINNWATWCPPCKAEMPILQDYFDTHRQQNFVLIGIEAGEPAEEVAAFAERHDLSFPVWVDTHQAALTAFKTDTLPSSFVVDRDGQVVLAWTGPISREMLEKYVTPFLE